MASSPFDALDAAMSVAVTRAFGEEAIITPRRNRVYAAPTDDPERAAVQVSGVYSTAPAQEVFAGNRAVGKADFQTPRSYGRAEFWLSATEFQKVGFPILRGDHLTLLRTPAETFAVVEAQPGPHGDVRILLANEDSPS